MRFENPFRPGIVAAIALFLGYAAPLAAQEAPAPGAAVTQTQPAPDSRDAEALLEQLAQADPAEAKRIDRQLQALWRQSGSPAMDLLFKRGREALEAGDTAAAIEHLTALTDHAPGFAEGWLARASAYFQAELHGPALADLERALALNPMNYNAIFGLGSILETFGAEKLAHDAYMRVRAIHPHHEDAGKALERLGPRVGSQTL
ncbi:MAG TPA: hypothetical protein DEA05_01905 [Rhodobacteraceae bacterium]|nr:hypothetical protein [Paracoccaceae bacterium]